MGDGDLRLNVTDLTQTDSDSDSSGTSSRSRGARQSKSTNKARKKITKKVISNESDDEDSSEEYVHMGLDKKRVPRSKIKDEDISRLTVRCTACNKQVLHKYHSKVRKHLHMGVLICEDCADFYKNGEFSQDESGDKYCRWCGQGGTLAGCDYCSNVFCNICLKRNFGRGEWNRIQKQDKWQCYICNPDPIKGLVAFCKMIVDYAHRVSGKKAPNHSRKNDSNSKSTKKEMQLVMSKEESLSPEVIEWLKDLVDGARVHMENKASELYKLCLELKNLALFEDVADSLVDQFCGKMRSLLFDHVHFISRVCKQLKRKQTRKKPASESLNGNSPKRMKKEDSDEEKEEEEEKEEISEPEENQESLLRLELSPPEESKPSLEAENDPQGEAKMEDSQNVEMQEEEENDSSNPPQDPELNLVLEEDAVELEEDKMEVEEGGDKVDPQPEEKAVEEDSNCDAETIKRGLSKLINDVELGEANSAQLSSSDQQETLTNGIEPLSDDEAPMLSDRDGEPEAAKKSSDLAAILPLAHNMSNNEAKNLLADLLDSDNEESTKPPGKPPKLTCKAEASSPRNNFTDSDDEDDKEMKKPKLKPKPASVSLVKLDESIVLEYLKENSSSSKDTQNTKQNKASDLEKEVANLCKMTNLNKPSKTKPQQPKTENDEKKKQPEKKEKKQPEKKESQEEDEYSSESDHSDVSIDEQIEKLLASAREELKDGSEEDEDEDSEEPNLSEDEPSKKNRKKKKAEEEDTSDSDEDFVVTKKKLKSHRLLTVALSDSENEKSGSNSSFKKRNGGKRKQRSIGGNSSSDLFSSHSSDEDLFKKNKKGGGGGSRSRKRRRIKQFTDSSNANSDDEEDNPNSTQESSKGRKNIRKIFSTDKLRNETKAANQAEKERRRRVAELQKTYNQVVEENKEGEKITRKLVLEKDKETGEELVTIHPDLIVKLKPHQVEGVKFMWECTIESIKRLKETEGEGCVLAHCMGLGKTLQVIVFLHTLLTNPHTKEHLRSALVLCPYNTVLNWAHEFDHWLQGEHKLKAYVLTSIKDNFTRGEVLAKWKKRGGVMICGYDMFRNLTSPNKRMSKKLQEDFATYLLDPGPDVVVCDEGHILKNINTAIAKATTSIRCRRRIVLTGTPLQNNLTEYHCMVQFVKPHLLGTKKEFQNRFVNPIMNGQCADSNAHDVHLMKKRAHILHSLLGGCVQRCDYGALRSFLPPKYEYVISIRLSETQIKMYRYFLDNFSRGGRKDNAGTAGTALFWDFNNLRQIWSHPYTFHINGLKKIDNQMDDEDSQSMKDFINDDSSTSSESGNEAAKDEVIYLDSKSDDEKSKKKKDADNLSSSSDEEKINKWKSRSRSTTSAAATGVDEGASTSAAPLVLKDPEPTYSRKEWWLQYYSPENDHVTPDLSGKILLFLDILRECEAIGDKVLVFSQSLLTLDLIEEVLKKVDEENEKNARDQPGYFGPGSWVRGLDYFRMDGSTNIDCRKKGIQIFNDEDNMRARLFMISTKAGSLGTNLIGANRVIIMDASWNPTHDVQAIFRVYRFGQKKPVYIYRFLAQGTMEEKIYDRQVTKQSLSYRVLDEHQIERHFNAADLAELYSFNPDTVSNRPTPMVPKDLLLAELLMKRKDWISTYHEHDSLLQNVVEEDLTEEERKLAWQEYEAEKEGLLHSDSSGLNLGANIFGVTISKQPVSYDKIDKMPDAKADIAAIIESIKQNRPGISQSDLNAALMSVLIIRRSHQHQCHALSVKQKQEFIEKNQPVPPQLVAYLEALNISIQQIKHVIQSLNIQKNYQMYNHLYTGYRQRQPTYPPPQPRPRPNFQQRHVFSQFLNNPMHLQHLREQLINAKRNNPGAGDKSYKVTVIKMPPNSGPSTSKMAAPTSSKPIIAEEVSSSTNQPPATALPQSTVTITEIE